MKLSKKAVTGMIIGGVLVIALPLGAFAFHAYRSMSRFPEFGGLSASAKQLLASKGVTFPTGDEMKKFQDEMRQSQEEMKKLSLTDRQSIEKATRDAMRAKGITLPSEEEFTKIQTTMQQAKDAWNNLSLTEKASLMHGMRNRGNQEYREGNRGNRSEKRGNSRQEFGKNRKNYQNEERGSGFGFGMMGFGGRFDDETTSSTSITNLGVTSSSGITSTGTTTSSGQTK